MTADQNDSASIAGVHRIANHTTSVLAQRLDRVWKITMQHRVTAHAIRALKFFTLPAVAFGFSLLAVLWWGVFILIEIERAASRRALSGDTANLSRVFEQNVIRSLGEIDKTLLHLRHAYQRDPHQANWTELIEQAYTASDIILQIGAIDARGRLIATNRGPQPPQPIDLSDQDHFRVHAFMPGDTIYISKPVFGRVTRQWSIQITRRLSAPDGTFAGVLVASLNPEHFAEFNRVIDLGAGGAVTLAGLDGTVGYVLATDRCVYACCCGLLGRPSARGLLIVRHCTLPLVRTPRYTPWQPGTTSRPVEVR